ncbi:MAG: hypothetical protein LBP59_20375 [Planctomycetaceae bacterium]|nr:hypothetical protein [Planctomycetaceae bacterium]
MSIIIIMGELYVIYHILRIAAKYMPPPIMGGYTPNDGKPCPKDRPKEIDKLKKNRPTSPTSPTNKN